MTTAAHWGCMMVGAQALRMYGPNGLSAIQAKIWPNYFKLKNITQGLRTIMRQASQAP